MQTSPHGVREAVYSYRYAVLVVDRFIDSYSRVINFVAKKLWMDPKELRDMLVNQFMHKNARWNVTRDMFKKIDRQDLYDELSVYDKETFVKYLTCVKSLSEDWLIDHEKLRKDLKKS